LLDLHGDVLLNLADMLRLDARDDDARSCVESALGLFERKGNIVSAEKARELLQVSTTTA
jgi:hypothetical protein